MAPINWRAVLPVDDTETPPKPAKPTSGEEIVRLPGSINVIDYGVRGDARTDDTKAMQAVMQAAVREGRGRVVIPSSHRILITGGDLVIPDGVSVIGAFDTPGEVPNGGQVPPRDYRVLGSSFILGAGCRIVVGNRNKLAGLLLISKPVFDLMPCPYNDQLKANAIVAAFAGLAVYNPGKYDTVIDRCMFLGFHTGILADKTGAERPRITHCLFDCTNGINWERATDFGYLESNHAWGFVTAHALAGVIHRGGTAFRFGPRCEWSVMQNCSVYGWNIGIHVQGSHGVQLIGCKTDGPSIDTGSTGFRIEDTTVAGNPERSWGCAIVGGRAAGLDTGLYVDVQGAGSTVQVVDWQSWGITGRNVNVVRGVLQASNVSFRNNVGIEIASTATAVALVNARFESCTRDIQNAAATTVLSQVNCISSGATTQKTILNDFALGGYRLWVDSTGRLRIKNGDPVSDTDGTIVGTQS